MIKSFKIFEDVYDTNHNKLYWYVPTKYGKLFIALKKIGAPQK